MLTTALVKSGKFAFMECLDFDKILDEQKLVQGGAITPESAPKVGKALGVELLVFGSVTEFGTKESAISGGGVTKKSARAAVDIRLVNATTGEVIAAEKEQGTESTSGFSVRYEGMDFSNASRRDNTDIGRACREAVDGCVKLIAENMAKIPWSGKMLKVNEDALKGKASKATITGGVDIKVGDIVRQKK
jgi:curli biogenesis system outer membrane secretion channel CsgG